MEDETLRAAWQRHAEQWIAWARTPGHDHHYWRLNLPAFLDLLPPPGRLTIDVGCGEGRLDRLLAQQGHRVLGVEASPTLARAAVTHAGATPVVLADAARLPIDDGAADLVVAFMSLHDIDDLDGALQEISRVLAPAGRLCAAVVHPINSGGAFDARTADATFTMTESYFTTRSVADTIERDGLAMTFTSVHRCLQTYWRALEAAGLVVDALREPRPDAAFVAAEPQAERWQRVPLFLHLRAVRKPARPQSATARSGPPRTRDGRRPGAAARRR
ncbi:MAG: class I SAM-dependent methyltransferase [Actinomycetota bacterium]|nr:class I SAM-dependent methyltransferase [Actinomycetota bacterium]